MRWPPAAIAWQLGARHRWWIVAGAVYFVVVAALCQFMPQSVILKAVRSYLALPLMGAPMGLLIVFLFGADADVASKGSLYPERMFTLPVGARALVAWPMLWGAAAMLAVCLAIGQLVLRTVSPQVPLWWPALLAAACLAWLQALCWSPFGLAWVRLVAAVAVLGGLIAVPSMARAANLPDAVLLVLLAAQLPAAYGVAVRGVLRARRGDSPDWQWLVQKIRRIGIRRVGRDRAFRSSSQAQLWLEWRTHGLGLPIAVGLLLPLFTALTLIKTIGPRVEEPPLLLQPVALFLLPLYVAFGVGGSLGGFGSPRKAGDCSFLATRPMDCAGFVLAKLKMALAGVLVSYALVVPVAVITVLCTRNYRALGDLLSTWRGAASPGETAAIGLVLFLLLLAVAWKLVADSMFIGLIGREWVIAALSVASVLLFFGLGFLGWWIYMHPRFGDALVAAVPYLLGLLVLLKLVLGGCVLRALYRQRLLGAKAIVRLVGLWLAVAAGLLGLAAWLVPRSVAPWHILACGVVLTVPMVRIGLAPLALAWNRHR